MAMTATSLYIPTISDHLDAHRNLTNNPEHVPDIVEFVTSPHFLNRPNLYPRQATWLKVIFLELEMLTDYDYQVIGEWSEGFKLPERPPAHLDPESDAVLKYSGDWGIVPDVIERMKILRSMNYRWFRQVLAVLGRRSAKGYVGGLAGSYVLWYYLMLGDARDHFGIDRDKRLACQVFAGKKMQARDNQWRDIVNVIAGAPCFQKYISQSLAESISVNSKVDLVRPPRDTTMDLATYEIVPKEATTMAARGPASFMQFYDEMAHMVSTTGGSRSAEEVYDSATPSLDQFKNLAFIYSGSSPWQMTGKFYELVSQTLQVDADTLRPVYPENIMLQLESWNIYEDWADTADGKFVARPKCTKIIPFEGPKEFPEITFKPLKNAIQEYDERMQRLERANPDTFRVERRCLDPDTKVLTADLTWVRIDDLVAGDRLVAVDEHPPGNGTQRRMRTAEVMAKWDSVSDAYRITFDDGSSVVCSGTHRWLSTTPSDPGSYRWRSLFRPEGTPGPKRSIKVGDSIAFMVDPWEEDSSREAGYLAGVYDGEGTAIGYPRREFRVSFVQNPGEVLDATLGYLRDKGFTPRYMPVEGKRAQAHVIQGLPEVLRFVGQIGGHKIRRQAIPAMWEGRGLGRVNGRSGCKIVASIKPLGERRLVDIETTTGTFIAEGLISHNSKWATVMDAYFPEAHVRRMFDPWTQFPAEEAPQRLAMKQKGSPTIDYVAHADPGKCLTAESMVYSTEGILKIPQVRAGDVLANARGLDAVERFVISGEKPIYRLRTKYGYEVRGSEDHPVLTQRGWVRIVDLVTNKGRNQRSAEPSADRVLMRLGGDIWAQEHVKVMPVMPTRRSNAKMCATPDVLDEDLGRLMGYLVAEGSVRPHSLSVTCHVDESIADECVDLIRAKFGVEPTKEYRKGKGRTVYWYNTMLLDVLCSLGLDPVHSRDKEIPWAVLQSPRSVVVEFLSAYFEGDGTVSKATSRDRVVQATTASKELARQVQVVLLNLGIVCQRSSSTITINSSGDRHDYWDITLRGESLRRFKDEIGFRSTAKQERLSALAEFPVEPLPDDLWLSAWDVEADGVEMTYDLTMSSGEHNFAANGIVCHNTGSNFGFAIGHKVMVPGQSLPHVVFDVIKAWQPQDFDSGEMDYEVIEAEMKEYVDNFMPTQLTFDQWNSIGFIQRIGAHSRKNNFKVTRTFERTATGPINWKTAETMKVALSLNLIHCPIYDLLELECLFLRKLPGDKVDHPDSGPVTTKDVYDAVSIVIHELIGADVAAYLGEQLSDLKAVTGLPGPKSPERAEDVRNQFSQFTAERREALRYGNPARPIPTRGRAPQRRR
jgi:intein/homing endonuclease